MLFFCTCLSFFLRRAKVVKGESKGKGKHAFFLTLPSRILSSQSKDTQRLANIRTDCGFSFPLLTGQTLSRPVKTVTASVLSVTASVFPVTASVKRDGCVRPSRRSRCPRRRSDGFHRRRARKNRQNRKLCIKSSQAVENADYFTYLCRAMLKKPHAVRRQVF